MRDSTASVGGKVADQQVFQADALDEVIDQR